MTTLQAVIAALTFFLMPTATTLYDTQLNPVVELPAGYFVMQAQAQAEAPDGYIAVIYDDLTGYVAASSVNAVDYTPVTKYELTATFACNNDGQSVNLRAKPSSSAEIVAVLNSDASGHVYGTMSGDTLIDGAGNTWYYVSYGDVRGYCYGAHVKTSPVPPNIIEKEEPVQNDDPPSKEETPPSDSSSPISRTTAIIFIVALCIPVPFVMFYLFKKPRDNTQ